MKSNKEAGFSLIELSVVLVILALLTGGILGGRHLIEAARVNKTLREVNEYKALFLQFDDRFGSLPGDLANATSYWPDCVDNTSNNRCNGNDDGFVGGFVTWYTNEPMRAMEHLSRAEMVSGQYNASAMTIHSAYLSVVSSSISMDSLPKSAFSDSAAYMISRVTSGHSLAAHLTGKDFVVLGALVPNGGRY